MQWQMILAPVGVIFLVLLTWWLGALKNASPLTRESANRRFGEDYPDRTGGDTIVARDGNCALLAFGDRAIGFVDTVGDKYATRLWRPGDLKEIAEKQNKFVLTTLDATDNVIEFEIDSSADLGLWRDRLLALTEPQT